MTPWLRVLIIVDIVIDVLLAIALLAAGATYAFGAVPQSALPYRDTLIRESRLSLGLGAPTAMFGGQIEQESGWNATICSPYACGLAQFTPATAKMIGQQIGQTDVFNPAWAIAALVRYDVQLHVQVGPAATDCDRWAFTLSAYNGGLGNVIKDRRLCLGPECQSDRWFGAVAARSLRSPSAFRENRGYPDAILHRRQYTYSTWGATVQCPRS